MAALIGSETGLLSIGVCLRGILPGPLPEPRPQSAIQRLAAAGFWGLDAGHQNIGSDFSQIRQHVRYKLNPGCRSEDSSQAQLFPAPQDLRAGAFRPDRIMVGFCEEGRGVWGRAVPGSIVADWVSEVPCLFREDGMRIHG